MAPERVTSILLAADERFRPAPPDVTAAFRERQGLPDRFVLYLGTLEPRKNVEVLVRAYAALRAQGSVDHALVLAGARGWQYESIFESRPAARPGGARPLSGLRPGRRAGAVV